MLNDPLSRQGTEIKPPRLPDKPKYETAHIETFDPRGQQVLKRNLIPSPIPPTHGPPKPGQDIPLWRNEDFTPDVGRLIFRAAQSLVHQDLVLPGGFQGCPQPASPPRAHQGSQLAPPAATSSQRRGLHGRDLLQRRHILPDNVFQLPFPCPHLGCVSR